jgi:serine/threonine protein kinase
MIGAGSTSEVYKVFDTNTGRFVAGKKIIMFDEPELSKSIKSELDILCGLEHPNIVRFYDHSHHHGDIWFFMEYLPETLEMVYRNYGKITEETARAYTKQLVSAVKYLHSNKIIHKDIKCSNVLISSEGVLKLSDFGSSKKFDQTNSVAAYNVNGAMTFKGSVLWMAPEVIR